jgi:hypothetical protein
VAKNAPGPSATPRSRQAYRPTVLHGLPRDAKRLRDLRHRDTGLDLKNRAIPLLHGAQLHQHSAKYHASSEANL